MEQGIRTEPGNTLYDFDDFSHAVMTILNIQHGGENYLCIVQEGKEEKSKIYYHKKELQYTCPTGKAEDVDYVRTKDGIDYHSTFINTSVRECREEAGIILTETAIQNIKRLNICLKLDVKCKVNNDYYLMPYLVHINAVNLRLSDIGVVGPFKGFREEINKRGCSLMTFRESYQKIVTRTKQGKITRSSLNRSARPGTPEALSHFTDITSNGEDNGNILDLDCIRGNQLPSKIINIKLDYTGNLKGMYADDYDIHGVIDERDGLMHLKDSEYLGPIN